MFVYLPPHPGAAPVPREIARPELAADELLVEVEAAVLAGPELLALDRGAPFAPGEAAVGRVVAAGAAGGVPIGARVLVGPVAACGECDVCRRGHPARCPGRRRYGTAMHGALASHVVARGRWVCALEGPFAGVALGPAAATLAREAPLAYTMFAAAGVAPGETTIWLGSGPIARLGRAMAASRGAVVVELAREELALAPAELSARLSGGGGRERLARPWKVFETSGRDAGRARALALAVDGATVVLLSGEAAGTTDDAPLQLAAALDAEADLIAVSGVQPDLMPETVALAARGDLDPGACTRLVSAPALADAIADLRAGRGGDSLTIVEQLLPSH